MEFIVCGGVFGLVGILFEFVMGSVVVLDVEFDFFNLFVFCFNVFIFYVELGDFEMGEVVVKLL